MTRVKATIVFKKYVSREAAQRILISLGAYIELEPENGNHPVIEYDEDDGK